MSNRYLLLLCLILGLTACVVKDRQYYLSHPSELQQGVKTCMQNENEGPNCEGIKDLAKRLTSLAYQLQSNPQHFGNQIGLLQETIAKQESELQHNNTNLELQKKLQANKQQLAEYLSVVKWLESPAS